MISLPDKMVSVEATKECMNYEVGSLLENEAILIPSPHTHTLLRAAQCQIVVSGLLQLGSINSPSNLITLSVCMELLISKVLCKLQSSLGSHWT